MLDKIKLNVVWIYKQAICICGSLFSLVAVVTSFITWDELGIEKQKRLSILGFIILFAFAFSAIHILLFKRKNIIWKSGNGKLQVCYGNVIKIANRKYNKKEQIIVIPVNTCFDTLVDNDITLVEKPLISPKSIHGQWVNTMINNGITLEELDSKIAQSIQVHNIQPVRSYTRQEKQRGKLDVYPLGTVIPVSLSENITFFLFALSELDENNKAQCSERDFVDGLVQLIDSYDDRGQGFEMFLPLVGTGMSRANIQHQEALQKIKATFELHRSKIKGTVNIVIYSKDSDKVSIFD